MIESTIAEFERELHGGIDGGGGRVGGNGGQRGLLLRRRIVCPLVVVVLVFVSVREGRAAAPLQFIEKVGA